MSIVKCQYCDNAIEDVFEICPICNAPNRFHYRIIKGVPKTIKELKDWMSDRKLPPENVIKYAIDENKNESNTMGIYRECNSYILYKNDDVGNRKVIYNGSDEEYAVNEAFLKIKEGILANLSLEQYELLKIQRREIASKYRKINKFVKIIKTATILIGLLLICSIFLQFIFTSVYR